MNNIRRIMVFDVPAESRGALTILNQYYDEALKDKNKKWIFVISTPSLKSRDNVQVVCYPWVKKSWFHRLYFDNIIAPKLPKKYKVDEIYSLQNVIIPRVKIKQTLYLHQALPFVEKRYKFTENYKFWIYQNIISKMIINSIKRADKIVVQTEWIMQAAINQSGVKREKFRIESPKIDIKINKKYSRDKTQKTTFFYPGGAMDYKNHKVIVAASKILTEKNHDFQVFFTLKGNENKETEHLYKEVKKNNLPIHFIGSLTQEQVFDCYSKSILIFASYIESFGLPLVEARMHNTPILATNLPFSLEILENYEKANFFNPFDPEELACLMELHILDST